MAVVKGAGFPNILIAIDVAMEAARKLTKLFPINITPINLSGDSSNFDALVAPGCLFLFRCLRR